MSDVAINYDGFTFDSFEASQASERNDYAQAARNAVKALNDNKALNGYVVKPSDLKRTTPYNAGKSAIDNMSKALKAHPQYVVVKGKIDNVSVMAVTRKSA